NEGDRTGRMAGNRDERHGRVAKRQRLAFGEYEIALRLDLIGGIRRRIRWIHQVPVSGGHSDLRAVALLKVRRAAEVIAVSMSDEDVLDVRGIEPDFLQPGDHFRLDAIRVSGVDQ